MTRFQFVFFDVDSTLVTIEGIDELAAGNDEIARLTDAAMRGELTVEQVYARRLEVIRPALSDIERLAGRYLESLTPGAAETIGTLREAGSDVHLVTAGIEQAIVPLADALSIPRRAVHAVPLRFERDGSYGGFDERCQLTRSGGKELVVRTILARSKGRSAFVGDGVTDLETKGLVDRFIGFGGVQQRPRVMENADIWVAGPSLADVLPYLLEES